MPLPCLLSPVLTSTPLKDSSLLSITSQTTSDYDEPDSDSSCTFDVSVLSSNKDGAADANSESSPPDQGGGSGEDTLCVELELPNVSVNAGYKLVFDNIDKTVKPRHMRVDSQTKSLHYVHAYAVKDRIDYSHVSDKRSDGNTNLYDVLPSSEDYRSLKKNFIVHVSRIILTHLDFFRKDFKGLAEKHIKHKYAKEMSQKSEVVSIR